MIDDPTTVALRYLPLLRSAAARAAYRHGWPDLVEDLAQDAWILAWPQIRRWSPERRATLDGWVAQQFRWAVQNAARAEWRRRRLLCTLPTDDEGVTVDVPDPGPGTDELVVAARLGDAFRRAGRSERNRAILELRLQGWSLSEIARKVGLSRTAVRKITVAASRAVVR